MKKILTSLLALAILGPASLLAPATLGDAGVAFAAEAAPRLELLLADSENSEPSLPSQCASGAQYGWSSDVSDTAGKPDSDCLKIRIANPDSRYTEDFRFCLNFFDGGGEQCTRWASEGGGESGTIISPRGAFGHAAVRTQTRSLGGGGYFTNVRASVRLAYLQSGESRCGASSGAAAAAANDGSPESVWAYGAQRDDDPGCGWIGLGATHVAPYRAEFAGSNLSGVELAASTTYALSRDFRVVMRNTGVAWYSGSEVSRTGNCDGYEPGFGAAPCSYTKIVTADNIRLERIDATPFVFDASRLQYRQEITVTHRSYQETSCEIAAAPALAPFVARLLGIPAAHALAVIPDGGGEGGDPPCRPVTRWVESVSEAPSSAILAPGTALFPASFRTPGTGGDYVLRFQMVKTDGAAEGTDASGRFGQIAEIPVTVAGPVTPDPTPTVGISCPVAELEARADSVATYSVGLSSHDSFAGTVRVTPSGMPSGATSPGASVTLAANASASALVPITIPAGAPAGRSTVTFTATGTNVAPASCTSVLVILPAPEDVPTFEVRPASGRVRVGETAAFEAYYDPDGAGGRAEQLVTAPAAWAIDSGAAVIAGSGRFQGMVAGTGNIRASYLGMSAPATLTVEDEAGATLVVRPASQQVARGAQAQFNAYYDPDGPGSQAEQLVTGAAQWAIDSSVGTSNGGGRFTGVSDGTANVAAHYSSLSATATLTVGGGDFFATLEVRPASQQVGIGGQAQYNAYYDPDGVGPQAEQLATAAAQWFITDSVATNDGGGRFTGGRNGTAGVEARYLGLSDDAALVVGSGAGDATLEVRPPSRAIAIGEATTFQAYYDPDGAGSLPERLVTGDAAWGIDAMVATNDGGGRFTGSSNGAAGVEARYLGLVGTASIAVGSGDFSPSLVIRPDSRQVDVGQQASFDAYYDPDGSAGTQSERRVTGDASWDIGSGVARNDGGGRFTGVSDGATSVEALYLGLRDTASLTVGAGGGEDCVDGDDCDDGDGGPPGPDATLRVSPDSASIAIGQQASFQAYYDADGPGAATERLVTVSSTWSSDSAAATSDGVGRFTGVRDGTAGVEARYRGLSDMASLRVGTGAALSCNFSADPVTLFIPPPRSTSLTWNCNQPAACTVTNLTRSRPVGSGSEAGSVTDQPVETTTYRLTCGGTTQQEVRVRVFDVTTRVEILPR